MAEIRSRRRWPWLLAVVVVVALGGAWLLRGRAGPGRPAADRAAPPPSRPVPVTAGAVARRDVPVYLEGLGNVVAYYTVTVKTLVDGRLDAVLFREGQRVKKGDVLAQVDPRPFQAQLAQAEGSLARDRAQLQNARLDLERYRALAAEKLIPQQQADAQVALVGQLDGSVRMDEAAAASARLNIEYARIKSPIDGVTGIRLVDPGNIVHPADQGGIVVVTQLDPIAVVFTLPQDELTPIVSEMGGAQLAVEAYARDGQTLLGSGRLQLIDNQINQATSTIRLKAIFPNPRRLLWPNQFVNARLRLTTRRGALVVAATAVQRGPSGTFVYVIGADATVEARPVEVEMTLGDQALIAKGLADGERVVVDGQNQLRPGARVAPREAGRPAAPPGSGGAPQPRTAGDGGGRAGTAIR